MKQCEWSEQMRAQRSVLERHAFRLCQDRDEACDLVQDTFERAWRCSGSFGATPPPRAWFLKVLTNLYLDHRKRRRVIADVSIALEEIAGEAPSPPPITPEDALAALTQIPHELREVIEAHELRGLRYCEIADTLDLPIGTVGTRLERARSQLKQLLMSSGEVH